MTDQTNQQNASVDPTAPPRPTERQMLFQKAQLMGISHSNNISDESLRQKINDKLSGADQQQEAPKTEQTNALEAGAQLVAAQEEADSIKKSIEQEEPAPRQLTLREHLLKESMKLVRCRITNLDPKKKDIPGEIITVANEYIGTVRKFVPFGEYTDEGYHIPYCIYEFLRERRFLNIKLKKHAATNTNEVIARYTREFSLEVLEPLTKQEIQNLANAQAAAGSIRIGDEKD